MDDNVTLPMNAFSIAKTHWLLALFDYLCVRTDPDGRRTSKIGEGSLHCNILQHAAMHCTTLQYSARYCNAAQARLTLLPFMTRCFLS